MKKLLLAITMMVGLVAGFSLTSCGGGGGGDNEIAYFTGKTFSFENLSTGSMRLSVGAAIGGDGKAAHGTLTFENGLNTPATIRLTKIGKDAEGNMVSCNLLLYGLKAEVISHPTVLAYFNMSSRNDGDINITNSVSIMIELETLPQGMNSAPYSAVVGGVEWDDDGGDAGEWTAAGMMYRTH